MTSAANLKKLAPEQAAAYLRVVKSIKRGRGTLTPASEMGWRNWLDTFFSRYVGPMSDHHVEFWTWVDSIQPGFRPPPFIAIWPRGGGKSTNSELAAVYLGAKNIRSYAWYIGSTQEAADRHVESIADIIENPPFAEGHGVFAKRYVGKYGASKGWRRSRLRTASGFVVDAIGLDTARRGSKLLEKRPDFMIFDDIDEKHDSLGVVKKKIEIITTSILPAGSKNVAVLFVQNLIHSNSIVSKMADGTADFLIDRFVSGPHPAIKDLVYEQNTDGEFVIISGEPTWELQDLENCQQQINLWGITAFLQEAQHEVEERTGGIWDHIEFRHCRWDEIPTLFKCVVAVDPAISAGPESDANGIQADGITEDGMVYRLYSWEAIAPPEQTIRRAIIKAVEIRADSVVLETDQGGEAWRSVYSKVLGDLKDEGRIPNDRIPPRFESQKAGAGLGSKVERNLRMLAQGYERGKVIHVIGPHISLEKALRRFPATKPFDLADASFHSWWWLQKNWGRRSGGVYV